VCPRSARCEAVVLTVPREIFDGGAHVVLRKYTNREPRYRPGGAGVKIVALFMCDLNVAHFLEAASGVSLCTTETDPRLGQPLHTLITHFPPACLPL